MTPRPENLLHWTMSNNRNKTINILTGKTEMRYFNSDVFQEMKAIKGVNLL